MSQTLDVTELAIVIAAANADPTLLSQSFLIGSGIVPGDWELARQPVMSQRASQIIYNNGVNLVAQPNRLTLVEALRPQSEQSVESPAVARRYIKTLPHLDYQAVGLNFRGYIPFPSSPEGAHDYLFKTLLASGPWQEVEGAKVQVGLNYVYTFSDNRLNLSINEAALELPESEQVPIILFSGNFDYDLSETPASERPAKVQQIIDNWNADLKTYEKVVNKFLEKPIETELVFPVPASVG